MWGFNFTNQELADKFSAAMEGILAKLAGGSPAAAPPPKTPAGPKVDPAAEARKKAEEEAKRKAEEEAKQVRSN